jgi:hypothetical protein
MVGQRQVASPRLHSPPGVMKRRTEAIKGVSTKRSVVGGTGRRLLHPRRLTPESCGGWASASTSAANHGHRQLLPVPMSLFALPSKYVGPASRRVAVKQLSGQEALCYANRSQPTLRRGSCGDRIEGRGKDREEGIALGAELDPTVSGDRIT